MKCVSLYPSRDKNSFKGAFWKFQKTPRDKKYLKWISSLPCLICRSPAPNEAHHATTGGMGLKSSDYETVPLCRFHHQQWHDHLGKSGGLGKTVLKNILERLILCYPGIIKS